MNEDVLTGANRDNEVKFLKSFALILILLGTAALLLNEFLLQLDRTATLIFALISLLGFAILGLTLFWNRK